MRVKTAEPEGNRTTLRSNARPGSPVSSQYPAGALLLRLQSQHGNRFVQRFLAIARKANANSEISPDLENAIQSARGNGRPVESGLRNRMETAFGASFGGVRVHTDTHADALNRSLNARAFTVGQDIFFRQGEYDPGGSRGRELLAHELTHVVQQGGAGIQRMPAASESRAAEASLSRAPKDPVVQRMCDECEEERSGTPVLRALLQPKLMVSHPDDHYEREADAVARSVLKWDARVGQDLDVESPPPPGNSSLGVSSLPVSALGRMIQRVPSPGSNFGTYKFCGFGITTPIPGFIKDLFTGSFDVDYTTGCKWIAANAWSSVWELYDASDTKIDSNSETAFGDYTISSAKVNSGTPGDGSAKWSLWYRITASQPWLRENSDAYPYDYALFNVYSAPIRNPSTTLKEELGQVIWQDNFTPAENGASLSYNFSVNATRSTTDSQTTSVSGTVAGDKSSSLSFAYDGLTGGFSNRLSYSATASVSRTHSITVSTSYSTSKSFNQPNLQGGVTYKVIARPLYHLIDGSVDLIKHRDGVVTGTGDRINGAIRMIKGLDVKIETSGAGGGAGTATGGAGALAKKWGCEDVRCNVQPARKGATCPDRVIGNSAYIYSNFDDACEAAKKDANSKVPEGCYKRHCDCETKCSQK